MIVSEALVQTDLSKSADKTVEVALASVREFERDGNPLTDDLGEIDRAVFRIELGGDAEEPRNAFLHSKAHEEKGVLPQGRFDRDDPVILRIWHISCALSLLNFCSIFISFVS